MFWLAGFTYPTGFLTAILQSSARRNGIPIDNLTWEFIPVNQDESSIQVRYFWFRRPVSAQPSAATACRAPDTVTFCLAMWSVVHFFGFEVSKLFSRSTNVLYVCCTCSQVHPKEGAYVRGLFIEGARWDFDVRIQCRCHAYRLQVMNSRECIQLYSQGHFL